MDDLTATERMLQLAGKSRQGRIDDVTKQIAVLWPTMDFLERMDWCKNLATTIWGEEGRWTDAANLVIAYLPEVQHSGWRGNVINGKELNKILGVVN